MVIESIEYCVCCRRDPKKVPDVHYGMPIMQTWIEKNDILFDIGCPSCGRGFNLKGFKSVKKAIDWWNNHQKRLKSNDIHF